MAVIYHDVLGVESDVADEQVEVFCVPVEEGGPGWIEGPAPWPRDDFGVAHKPDPKPAVRATPTKE
jgi:hypothetical protein